MSENNYPGSDPSKVHTDTGPTDGSPGGTAKQNPYEFILNPKLQPKKAPFGGDSKVKKVLVVVAGITFLVLVIGIVSSMLLSKKAPSQNLTALVQQQQELIRIATQGERQAVTESTRGLSYSIALSINTNQKQLLAYLNSHGVKLNEKQLALKYDASTDKLLTDARATSTYENALQKIYVAQLQAYISDLQNAYNATSSKSLRQILSDSYQAGKILLGQAQLTLDASD